MIIKIELSGEKEQNFNKLKDALGLNFNSEVVNYALNRCYKSVVKKEVS